MGTLPEGGTVRPMTRWGDPVMHRPCRPVETYDPGLHALVADMTATMDAADGVGLAANQVGVDLRVFVFRCADDGGVLHQGVVCNPVLDVPTGPGRRLVEEEEGCLSLPGAYAPCARPDEATVRGADEYGNPVEFHGTGMLARCLQHETDHLDGTVFADRLSRRVRRRLFGEAEIVAEDFPDDWPVSSRLAGG
ncbi:peptide deformylase [Actinopolymorpha cephalotaxi]|uniref:Peptide deformylase n=1 Tax=Actinopolymorpha cephalotaxi TaxID=504797 RepID=A0A1I2Z2S7_9ACTN|nr:peptide deformylase [Actinopolymorpha cephalotaxi]NYH81823.1 peptide deformylase [Actinopolymorpha cephalotaxi]SFH31935.1 peptide deformylase [Actinopolymorpha cephalotaxi]